MTEDNRFPLFGENVYRFPYFAAFDRSGKKIGTHLGATNAKGFQELVNEWFNKDITTIKRDKNE